MSTEPHRLPTGARREPKPPAHLSPEARRLWRSVAHEFTLEAHHLAVLGAAAEALDRMRQAQAAIKDDGAYIEGRTGLKPHPGIAVERDSRLALLRALRELGLDFEPVSGQSRTAAARASRWS